MKVVLRINSLVHYEIRACFSRLHQTTISGIDYFATIRTLYELSFLGYPSKGFEMIINFIQYK